MEPNDEGQLSKHDTLEDRGVTAFGTTAVHIVEPRD